jgi:rubrerythrin
MSEENSRQQLIALLQIAYSAERAAAYAYRGHWHSVVDGDERARIRQIEEEEWHHRELVGDMLEKLGAQPSKQREFRSLLLGRALGLLCHVMGWFAPMYGAGRLESHNIREYETAARYARDCSREEFTDCLLTMAEVEWEHESYFRSRVMVHSFGKKLRLWPAPPPKETIRETFAREADQALTLV